MTDSPSDSIEGLDAGEPVQELAGLGETPSERFLERVLEGVHRRRAASQVIELGWWGLTGFLAEILQAVVRALGMKDGSERS
jgi:hypothetical protein